MRWHIKMALAVSAALLLAGMAQAQGFGGFGGRGGPGMGGDLTTLLRNPSVKKELKLEDEQLAKVPDAMMKALAEVLTTDQLKRLKQIQLQLKGAQAFMEADVQKTLKLTDEQLNNIKTIQKDANEERKELFAMMKEGQFAEAQKKMQELTKETDNKVTGVLNAQQRKMWKEMTGPEFKIAQPKFGGGGALQLQPRPVQLAPPEFFFRKP
jgi:hypothetical protein